MKQVPTEHFYTEPLPNDERLPALRQITAPLYDIQPLDDPADFYARSRGYRVKNLIFNHTQFSAVTFHRGAKHLRSRSSDFLVLQEQLRGEEQLAAADGRVRLVPGYLFLRDWGQAFDSTATAMELRSVVIPRHLLKVSNTLSERQPVLSLPLSEPTGRAFALLWNQLWRDLPEVSLAEAERLCTLFIAALDAIWGLNADRQGRPTLEAMLQFLNVRLSGRVGVADLVRQFKVSRSTVHRLFEPVGGVRTAIKLKQLEHCYAELWRADPAQTRVSEIGASWGFADASTFSRSFRAQFGVPPSKVLGGGVEPRGRSDAEDVPGINPPSLEYLRWFRDASGFES